MDGYFHSQCIELWYFFMDEMFCLAALLFTDTTHSNRTTQPNRYRGLSVSGRVAALCLCKMEARL